MITLGGIELPNDLYWSDEMEWCAVEETHEYSLEGALLVDGGTKQAGRPITLIGSEETCWIDKDSLSGVKVFESTPGKTMALVYGSQTFNVKFDLSNGPAVTAEPIIQHNEFIGPGDYYNNMKIKLLVV